MFSIFKPNLVDFYLGIPEAEQNLPLKLKKTTIEKLQAKPQFDLDLAKSYIRQDEEIMKVIQTVSKELSFDMEDYFQKFLEILIVDDPEASILILETPQKLGKVEFLKVLKTYFSKFNPPNVSQVIAPDIVSATIAYYTYVVLGKAGITLTLDVILLALNITNKMEMPEDFNPDVEYPDGTKFKGKGY